MHKGYLLLVLAFGAVLAGCLGDEVGEEVKPRVILQPPYVIFQAKGTSDLMAKWGPSLTDTQQNFKGYYIELYTSDTVAGSELDSIIDTIARAHAPRSDTSYLFNNIAPGRYTLYVWGERYPDPSYPDSLPLSKFPARFSFVFDPTPVTAPTKLYAHSVRQGTINIHWNPSSSQPQAGMAGYIIRYRNDANSSLPIFTFPSRPGNSPDPLTLTLQVPLKDLKDEPYKIWIKGIRNDSTESADSSIIIWSGAHELGLNQPTVQIGKKIFIGQANIGYEIKQHDGPEAQIGVTANTDSVVTLEAFNGAKFSTRIDIAPLDSVFFDTPIPDAEYTESTLTLPRNPSTSVCIYVLFVNGWRARIMFSRDALGTLIFPGNLVRVQAKFQPTGPPDNLTYF